MQYNLCMINIPIFRSIWNKVRLVVLYLNLWFINMGYLLLYEWERSVCVCVSEGVVVIGFHWEGGGMQTRFHF